MRRALLALVVLASLAGLGWAGGTIYGKVCNNRQVVEHVADEREGWARYEEQQELAEQYTSWDMTLDPREYMADTQITDSYDFSCTMGVYNQDLSPMMTSGALKRMSFGQYVDFYIADFTTAGGWPVGTVPPGQIPGTDGFVYRALWEDPLFINPAWGYTLTGSNPQWFWVGATTGWQMEIAMSITAGHSHIDRTRNIEPWRGSTIGPTHAVESRFTDTWEAEDVDLQQVTYTFGEFTAVSILGSLAIVPPPSTGLGFAATLHKAATGTIIYAAWSDLQVSNIDLQLDALEDIWTSGNNFTVGRGANIEVEHRSTGFAGDIVWGNNINPARILDLRETGLCGWGDTSPNDDLYGSQLHWLWNGYAVCPVWRYLNGPLWVPGDPVCGAPPGTYPMWAGPTWDAVAGAYTPMWNPLDAYCPFCGSRLRPGGMLKVPWVGGWPDTSETDWTSVGAFQDSTEAPLTQAQLHSVFSPYAQRLTPYSQWDKKLEYRIDDYDLLSGSGGTLLVDRKDGRRGLLPDTLTRPGGVPVIPIHVGGCNSTDCAGSPYFDLDMDFAAVDVDLSGTTGTRVSAWESTDFVVTGGAVGTLAAVTFTVPAGGGTLERGPMIDPYFERNAAMIAATAGGAFSECYIYHKNNTAVPGGWPAGWSDTDCMGGGHAGVDVTWWGTHRYATLVAAPDAGWDGVTLPQLKLTYSTEAVEDNLFDAWPMKDVEVTVAASGMTVTINGKRNGDTVYYDLVYPDFARLEHVTQVEVIFAAGAAGAWTLDGFRLDPSDAAPGATAELSTTTMHQCHHSYDWGGIRGVIDGRCILALRATDCGAALYQPRHVWEKGLEELIPDVDEVYSYHPVDGTKDVSTVYGIEKYARLMGAVGEGWDVGMPADWNSIYKDGDGTVLDIGRAFDVVENQDYGGVQCGFSGWLWQGVAGLCYTPHGVLCAQGGMHGLSNATSACCGSIFRKAPAAADWDEYRDDVGSEEHGYWSSGADVVHHYVATDAIEYEYRVNKPPRNTDFERIWERQWIWSYLWIGKEKGLMLVEHIPNIVYVFDFDGYDISHIYTAPPDLWYSEGKTLSPYSLPHTDVESCDGSQSGYVDAHGFIYLYYIDDGTLKRVISEDWGAHWGDGVAVISDQSIEKAFCYEQDGVKICVAIDNSGAMKCYRSSTHFDDATWTADVNVFAIATGITKEAQPCIQFQRGVVYVYAIKDDVVSIHKSEDVGKTWA